MIKFTKMQGLGNDYVYIDATKEMPANPSKLAQNVSNRHFGIGSDGLILICPSNVADFQMKMYNPDGSEAEMCGNGIRCVGKFVYDKHLTNKTTLTIETLAGIKELELFLKDNQVDRVQVDMGLPIFEATQIPVVSKESPVLNLNLMVEDRDFTFTCVSMGNPHAITVAQDVESFPVEKYGPIIETHHFFPNKVNVEFIEILDRHNIKMRVWERGTGETMACGTGACAVAVAAILNNLTERQVSVHLPGGILQIEWNAKDNHVYLTGQATTVFEGQLIESKE